MRCSCGLPSAGECRELFHTSSLREFEDFRYAGVHRLKIDAYALQHPDVFCVSAKSLAAHLGGLCIALDFESNPFLMTAVQKWLNGKRAIEKPPLPQTFGSITVADVVKSETSSNYHRAVRLWAECVWAAYSAHHELPRAWVEAARDFTSRR